MGRYPDGTSAGDPRAPWNQPEAPECRGCGQIIHQSTDHDPDCPNGGMEAHELLAQREEDAKVERAERRMDEQRLQEAIED